MIGDVVETMRRAPGCRFRWEVTSSCAAVRSRRGRQQAGCGGNSNKGGSPTRVSRQHPPDGGAGRRVDRVICVDRPWVVPFVQPLAEYVVEISESVLERLEELQPETYRRFAVANEPFMRLTRNRIVSYWACYYRLRYRLPAYPPVRS